jgi:hypothetical protein
LPKEVRVYLEECTVQLAQTHGSEAAPLLVASNFIASFTDFSAKQQFFNSVALYL